ncbi:MAG: ribosome biogenesis factor YjgA [Ostreibacterium sp.]
MGKQDRVFDEEGFVIRINKEEEKRKREVIKVLVKELLKLPTAKYVDLPIDKTLRMALEEGKRLTNNAFSRHLAFVVRLVHEQGFEQIQSVYERIHHSYRNDSGKVREIERYRRLLIKGDKSVIDELLLRFVEVDIQYLRQLARNAKKEIANETKRLLVLAEKDGRDFDGIVKPTKSSKLLYQYLFKLALQ